MKQTKEWIRKRIESIKINVKTNPNYGMRNKNHSIKTKLKMSSSAIKRFENIQERNKIANSRMGMKFTPEHLENLKLSHLGQRAWNKNIKMSEKVKIKNSIAHKNQIPWNKGLKGIMVAWNKGKRMSEEIRQKQRDSNSHFWKGGVSKLNDLIKHSSEYKQWRKSIFERDNYTCLICGKIGGKINAHHIKKFSVIIEENQIKTFKEALDCLELWDTNNGVTLCIECHYLNKHGGLNGNQIW